MKFKNSVLWPVFFPVDNTSQITFTTHRCGPEPGLSPLHYSRNPPRGVFFFDLRWSLWFWPGFNDRITASSDLQNDNLWSCKSNVFHKWENWGLSHSHTQDWVHIDHARSVYPTPQPQVCKSFPFSKQPLRSLKVGKGCSLSRISGGCSASPSRGHVWRVWIRGLGRVQGIKSLSTLMEPRGDSYHSRVFTCRRCISAF